MSDIAAMFARDPAKLTKDDVTAIVEKLRSMRHVFNSGISGAGNIKKIAAPVKSKSEGVEFDL